MQQTATATRYRAPAHAPRGLRPGEALLGCLLGFAIFYATLVGGDNENVVVSIEDLDTAIIVSMPVIDMPVIDMPVMDFPARIAAAAPEIVLPTLAAAPVAALTLPVTASVTTSASAPAIDLLDGITTDLPGTDDSANARATFVGIASTYNPFERRRAAVGATASGETYDPQAWTAAIQIALRHDFGGVRFGRLYRPTFALVERGDKRAIVRINDVGPLRPGRVIDLNARSMRYFDPSLRLGLVRDMKITLLPGDDWTPGPVQAGALTDLASAL